MVSPTDTNQVLLTGENNYMRLHIEENGPMTTRASHWRILLSSAGAGHVLFLKSDVTNDEVRIYSDNIAVARWLQDEIVGNAEMNDPAIPVITAAFDRSGDASFFWTESIETEEESIELTWYDFVEPFTMIVPPGSAPDRPLGWNSVFVPARRAQLTLNGEVAQGRPFPEQRGVRLSSTAGLALSETWVRPA